MKELLKHSWTDVRIFEDAQQSVDGVVIIKKTFEEHYWDTKRWMVIHPICNMAELDPYPCPNLFIFKSVSRSPEESPKSPLQVSKYSLVKLISITSNALTAVVCVRVDPLIPLWFHHNKIRKRDNQCQEICARILLRDTLKKNLDDNAK